jgi:hypothetical protein
VVGAGAVWIVAGATAAGAHVEFEPATAEQGSSAEVVLFVEDERSDAATSKVELFFPEDVELTVVAVGPVEGWTATVVGGELGGAATGVTWEGGPTDGDLELPITFGPIDVQPTRLQFKVLHTYDNGEIDRWIGDNPLDGDADESPGPVLDIYTGTAPTTAERDEHGGDEHDHADEHDHGDGEHSESSGTEHGDDHTAGDDGAGGDESGDGGGGGAGALIALGVVVLGGVGAALFVMRGRRRG